MALRTIFRPVASNAPREAGGAALNKFFVAAQQKNEKKLLTFHTAGAIIIKRSRDARVVELADSLDSGSSVHYARAGSSPASRTMASVLTAFEKL